MKIIRVFIIPILIVLSLLLTSCTVGLLTLLESAGAVDFDYRSIPETSDTFSQEFLDSFPSRYQLYSPNLHYLSMKPYEVRVDNLPLGGFCPDVRYFLISSIDNVSIEEFVAVTHYRRANSDPFVYRRKDAPIPMKDYTVSSVSVVGTDRDSRFFIFGGDFEDLQDKSQNYMERFLEYEYTKTIAEYSAKDYPDLISHLQKAYTNTTPDDLSAAGIVTEHAGEGDSNLSYWLLFRFEETENLVFFVQLLTKVENDRISYYYGYSYYEVSSMTQEDGTEAWYYEKKSVLAPISEEFAAILIENIP